MRGGTMKSLIYYYTQIESKIRNEIKHINTLQQVVQIVQSEIQTIAHHDSDYILSLTDSQRTLAWEQLSALSDSFNILTAIESPRSHQKHHHQDHNNQDTNDIVPCAISGAVSATLTGGFPVVSTVVGAGVGAIVGVASNYMLKNKGIGDIESHSTRENQIPLLRINPEPILSNLYQGFENIDKAVARCLEDRKKQPDKPNLDKLTDVLAVLQDLMGEELDEPNQIPTLMSKQLKRIPAVLRHYGMEARVYETKGEPSDQDWKMFEFESSLEPDLQEYVTTKPAFVKGNEVILQGRVIEPATPQ